MVRMYSCMRNVVADLTYTMECFSGHSRFSSTEAVSRHLTLRNANQDYKDNGGRCWTDAEPAELGGSRDQGYVLSLVKFENIMGHVSTRAGWLYDVREFDDPYEMVSEVTGAVSADIEEGSLWTMPSFRLYTKKEPGVWRLGDRTLSSEQSNVLDRISALGWLPVSASTVHSALEASTDGRCEHLEQNYFVYPRDSVPSTGLYGTLHNNQVIDMSPYEERSVPDTSLRAFRDDYIGFICAGHTSHSVDAGRIRRVTCDVRVRVMGKTTLEQLSSIARRLGPFPGERDWTLFMCGLYCKVTLLSITNICVYHRLCAISGISSFSLYINISERMCAISISSGTLVKLTSNGVWADSVETYHSDRLPRSADPKIDVFGKDMLRACMSTYFNLHPYIASDRPPRPSISSAQTPQAVCLPFCPATAAVSPCYTFKPLVTTPVYREIMAQAEATATFADYLPGENIMVLYLNDEENYEDAIYVSSRYVDNGGFSTLSICKYLLPYGESIPDVGDRLCQKLVPWWKNPCQVDCTHTVDWMKSHSRAHAPQRHPSGVLISKSITSNGEWQVKVRSFQQLQTGDKVSTGHGQKGVVTVKRDVDMPMACTDDGEMVVPDMVVAMSSIICRQTNGQLYETHRSLRVLQTCEEATVDACQTAPVNDEVDVFNGTTGEQYMTMLGDAGRLVPTRASLGFVRVHNQTQMTRERHFTSHRTVHSSTLRTPTRRAPGGGVALGEMEIQAAVSAGLVNCVSEITRRGDQVIVKVCTQCQRLRLLCGCTKETNHVDVTLPYDTVVVDCISAIVYEGSNVYTIEIEC